MTWIKDTWKTLDETLRFIFISVGSTLLIVALIVALVLSTAGPDSDKVPDDWNPNVACHTHGGVTSVHGSDYAVGATCKDNFYVSNPYDNR